MSELALTPADGRTWWLPCSTLWGIARWRLDVDPDAIELRLIWVTSGKGTRDVEVVDRLRFDQPGPGGDREFTFDLPEGPYSFAGTLVSLQWALEMVVEPGEDSSRLDLVVSPTPVEVRLAPVDG